MYISDFIVVLALADTNSADQILKLHLQYGNKIVNKSKEKERNHICNKIITAQV